MYKYKKRILIDLDGVLNMYNGNYDENNIPPLKEGAKDFLKELNENFELYLYTSRNLLLSAKWLINYQIDEYFVDITNIKQPAYLYVDDRAINFKGDYRITLDEIKKFKVYWK